MTGQCSAFKRNGERCTLPANGPHGLCWAHDPKNAEQRRRGASRGGKARANRELPDLKKQLKDLAAGVLDGSVDRSRAAVANQVLNTVIRAIEQERKVRELEEVAVRIEALEDVLKTRRTG